MPDPAVSDMDELFRDFKALMRCTEFGRGLPGLFFSIKWVAARLVKVFERLVTPIIDETIENPVARDRIHDSLLATSVKLSILICGYANMADVSFRVDVSVLGSAIARLYDDLLDEIRSPGIESRLDLLFRGEAFVPADDAERLFARLYRVAEQRMGRNRSDAVHLALARLHEYQIMSGRQKDPTISDEDLWEITAGKGGYGLAALFSMTRPVMGDAEHGLILELGSTLQLLDDYQDVALDRLSGICTQATRESTELSDVVTRLKLTGRNLTEFYGRGRARKFLAVVYATLWISFLRRRLPRIGTRAPGRLPRRREMASALNVLVVPGDNLVQTADQRRHGRQERGPAR
jgi:hypothetical protein